jgi:hypothetical protein
MKKLGYAILILVMMASLTISFASCTPTSELLPLAKNPAKAGASTGDYDTRINELEKRVEQLEQGMDERVIEYNMVQSAVYKMIVENGLVDRDWGSVHFGEYSSSWAPTNNMHLFPGPSNPLFGYDKNKDGKPDTNYVPFEKSKWFYEYGEGGQVYQFPDYGWLKLTKRPETAEEMLGKTEPYETELHNIQTAVMAMLADSRAGILDANLTLISDMDLVTSDGGALVLSNYLTGINADGTVKSGCKYDFAKDGTVIQRAPLVTIPSPPIPGTQKDYESEWHNIQTAVMAMLADSTTGNVTAGTGVSQTDMHNIQSRGSHGMLYLSDYLTGLNGTSVQSGCTYTVVPDGTVTQTIP